MLKIVMFCSFVLLVMGYIKVNLFLLLTAGFSLLFSGILFGFEEVLKQLKHQSFLKDYHVLKVNMHEVKDEQEDEQDE